MALGLLLISPYLIWLGSVPHWEPPRIQAWLPPLLTAAQQALLSATLAMIAGFFLFQSAQGWTSKFSRSISEMALLLPCMVPPLFLVLAILSWVTPWMAFPYGMTAVVLAHVLMNSGLVAVSLDRLVHNKLSLMAETSWILGATRSQFWRRVAWPYLKGDIACIFLFVFGLCFTSFSIPLLLGGRQAATLEVAIMDLIRMEGHWDHALMLAVVQSVVLFALAMLLPRAFWPSRPARNAVKFLSVPSSRILVFVPALILFLGWLAGVLTSGTVVFDSAIRGELTEAFVTTTALALLVGLLHLLLLLVTAFVLPHRGLERFLNGYLAPSPVITGFAILLLPGESDGVKMMKIATAMTLISFPLLYRWMAHSTLASLQKQVTVARTLGAGWLSILLEIVWPQAAPQLMRVCGLAALWASGDFAISGILAGDLKTVPLVMEGLMGNYRIEAAQLLMFPLLFLGLALYGVFTGAARYVSR